MEELGPGELYLGVQTDIRTGEDTGEPCVYDAHDLTTHGVIVGMTGSGKTGLGIIVLEEALLQGIPCLVLDPKGDMGNLLLNFPALSAEDFAPWVSEDDARRKEMDVAAYAAETADSWRQGLAASGIEPERMRRLKEGSRSTIYTPGSTAGIPLNIVGSLAAPDLDWGDSAEILRDEIEGFVTSLLGLAGIAADPIASREHILLSNIIETHWSAGSDLDLPSLIAQVQRPPFRKLGVFELDTFYPESDRSELALRLNGLIASPSFAEWLNGPPLDIETLLGSSDGPTKASIIHMAHLSDEARQFITTLVLSKLVTWMRGQPGTGDLRALVYMDEVFGFVPPSANPPAKKPILTILKQARAFGVGMVLSTQNPVDLDYKAMSNAGAWFCGRLQTERDKARVVEALSSARGNVDVRELDKRLSGLDKRQFLLQSAHLDEPEIFRTRWAMSFLSGPLTRDQVSKLMEGSEASPTPSAVAAGEAPPSAPAGESTDELAENESAVMPEVARNVPVFYLDPAAPWAQDTGAVPSGSRFEAALAARVHLLFDESRAGVDHREEWEAIYFPAREHFDASSARSVDFDQRDFRVEPPEGATYVIPRAPIHTVTYWKHVAKEIREELHRTRRVEIVRNKHLKLYSRVGESAEDFAVRCRQAAETAADAEAAKIRDRLEDRLERLQRGVFDAQQKVERLEIDLSSRRQNEMVSGAGAILGALLGGRSSAAKISRAATAVRGASSRRGITARTEKRLEVAREKVAARLEEIEVLEDEIVDELAEITDKWAERAADTETLTIGLEKSDIDVDEVAVLWIPIG